MTPEMLARARARVRGPVAVPVADPVPAGMTPATDGSRVWLLPVWPDGSASVLRELANRAFDAPQRSGFIRTRSCGWT